MRRLSSFMRFFAMENFQNFPSHNPVAAAAVCKNVPSGDVRTVVSVMIIHVISATC